VCGGWPIRSRRLLTLSASCCVLLERSMKEAGAAAGRNISPTTCCRLLVFRPVRAAELCCAEVRHVDLFPSFLLVLLGVVDFPRGIRAALCGGNPNPACAACRRRAELGGRDVLDTAAGRSGASTGTAAPARLRRQSCGLGFAEILC